MVHESMMNVNGKDREDFNDAEWFIPGEV